MDKFIRRMCHAFLHTVGDIMTGLCERISCPEAEAKIQARCDELALVLYSMFIEELDRQLREDR
ncbi:MAG: hypothetical protein NUW23_07485, partial [Firmicutes bacterium]|nr:hypothetical protein [Bacillota bacterium]